MMTILNKMLYSRLCGISVIILALFLCTATPLYAQSGSSDCPVGHPGAYMLGSGADLKCRMNTVLNSDQTLITTMKGQLGTCSNDPDAQHCQLIANMLVRAQNDESRAMNANGRATGDDYSDLNVIRKTKCKGNHSDCASGGSNAQYSGGNSDPGVGMDMAQSLDDATSAIDSANKMEIQAATLQAMQSLTATDSATVPSTFTKLYDYTTDPHYPHFLHPLGEDAELKLITGARLALSQATVRLEVSKEIAADTCDQTVVAAGEGGNTSEVCLAITGAWALSEVLNDVVEFADNNQLAWEVHGAYEREDDLNQNLGQVSGQVSNTQDQIKQLTTEVDQLQASVNDLKQTIYVNNDMDRQIMKLLLLPTGRRSLPASLLTCSGDASSGAPCPLVAISCSVGTGLCSFSPHQ